MVSVTFVRLLGDAQVCLHCRQPFRQALMDEKSDFYRGVCPTCQDRAEVTAYRCLAAYQQTKLTMYKRLVSSLR